MDPSEDVGSEEDMVICFCLVLIALYTPPAVIKVVLPEEGDVAGVVHAPAPLPSDLQYCPLVPTDVGG